MIKTTLLAAILLTLCLSAPGAAADQAVAWGDLAGRKFVLESVDGESLTAARQPLVEFMESGAIAGVMCNSFRGPAKLADGVLTVDHPAATLMMCPDERIMRLEADFFQMLPKGVRVTLDGRRLQLTGDGKTLEFREEGGKPSPARAATADDLKDTSYILIRVDGEEYGTEPRPRIVFDEHLSVHGKVCNGFRGQAVLEDGVLRAGQVISTRMLCVNNDLSLLETRFLRLLDSGLKPSVDGENLILRGDDAELVFRKFTRDDDLADALIGRRFVLKRVDGADFAAERQPFIEFNPGLRLTGSACNNFIGPGRLENGVLFMESAAATMMMCVDPNLSGYERDFHKLLREGATARLKDDTLTLEGGGRVFDYEAE